MGGLYLKHGQTVSFSFSKKGQTCYTSPFGLICCKLFISLIEGSESSDVHQFSQHCEMLVFIHYLLYVEKSTCDRLLKALCNYTGVTFAWLHLWCIFISLSLVIKRTGIRAVLRANHQQSYLDPTNLQHEVIPNEQWSIYCIEQRKCFFESEAFYEPEVGYYRKLRFSGMNFVIRWDALDTGQLVIRYFRIRAPSCIKV